MDDRTAHLSTHNRGEKNALPTRITVNATRLNTAAYAQCELTGEKAMVYGGQSAYIDCCIENACKRNVAWRSGSRLIIHPETIKQ